jgi:protein-disulfide isomerase
MIDERLIESEGRLRGVAPEDLLRQQREAAVVTDEDVEAFYAENRARLGDATLEQMAPRIRQHLEQQEVRAAERRFLAELRQRSAVVVDFEAPRTQVAAVGPALGPESAPVTIVEFSDFQCPFCARAGPVVKQVLARYPEQVRLVYRHYPLESIHSRARAAAEAAACAEEQDRFWDYHDLLFANARALEDTDLERYAAEVELDLEGFKACRAEGRRREAVERDIADAREAGVSGTPSFFINGRMLGGAQPLEEFVRVIEAELQRAGSS